MKRQNWKKLCHLRGHKYLEGQATCDRCRGQRRRNSRRAGTNRKASGGVIPQSQSFIAAPLSVALMIQKKRGRMIFSEI